MADGTLTIKEVARYLKVNERTVYRLAFDQKIPAFKVGNAWQFKRADLERWINSQQNKSSSERLDARAAISFKTCIKSPKASIYLSYQQV